VPGVYGNDFFSEPPEEPEDITGAERSWRDRFRRAPGQPRSFWRELPVLIVVALLLSFAMQTFFARVYVIPSESMEPTLHGCAGCSNDRVLVDKVSYRFSDPRPGDVVVFRGPDDWTNDFTTVRSDNAVLRALQELGAVVGLAPPDERDFVKRVIAVGGQTVQCCDDQGRVLVDGVALTEPFVVNDFPFHTGEQSCTTPMRSTRCFDPVTIPAGSLWVMGDNRSNSADSRRHGPVPVSNVLGKARLIVLPVTRWQVVDAPQLRTAAAAR